MKTFNRHTTIALNLLQYLYLAGGDTVTCEEMALALHESPQHCTQVLRTLRQKGYISSRRGSMGGYHLNAVTPMISVSQFLEDMGRGLATTTSLNVTLASERLSEVLETYADRVPLENIFIGMPENMGGSNS